LATASKNWKGKEKMNFLCNRHCKYITFLVLLCLVLLSSCSPVNSQSTATGTPTITVDDSSIPLPSPTSESLQNLLRTEEPLLAPHPLRNPYSLAQRLKLHGQAFVPQIGRTTPLHAHIGQEDTFWIMNQDTHRYSRIAAKLIYVTPHVYLYVENGQPYNLGALQASANVFESKIYPTDRATFGSEWSPGIDQDVHLTILNVASLGNSTSGYFNAQDEYPTSIIPYSNQREMFYMSLNDLIPGYANYNSTLAHEFQHLIYWHLHANNLGWADEGMSVLAQYLNGYPVGWFDQSFLQMPDTQLNDWPGDVTTSAAHYGAGYLFMDYFATHYGGYGILKELLQDPTPSPGNFNHVLAKHGYNDSFLDVLHKWYIANYVEDASISKGEYGYPDITLPGLTPQHTFNSYPISESDAVHQFAAEYYALPPPTHRGTLTINVKGFPLVRIINNNPYRAANEWWSNRSGNLDSTLTRSFDLTHLRGKRATLQFATWFDLQPDHDYAYVEVSVDGASWITLKGHYTTTSNPDGANWGNGYTGVSGGGSAPRWVQESVNLSPFIGKKIQIRFEQVTDETDNLQGFAIDAMHIPELRFQDTLATDNGWVSNGFIRSNNVLPEHFHVLALLYQGSQFNVSDVPIDLASGQGTFTIPNYGSSVNHLVLVVSAYAVETTQLAHYQLDINLK
jgi:immune inhibitor A